MGMGGRSQVGTKSRGRKIRIRCQKKVGEEVTNANVVGIWPHGVFPGRLLFSFQSEQLICLLGLCVCEKMGAGF